MQAQRRRGEVGRSSTLPGEIEVWFDIVSAVPRRAFSRTAVAGTCALWLAACAPAEDPSAASSEVPQQTSVQAKAACEGGDLTACTFPAFPNLTVGACDYLRQHLVGRQVGDETVQRVAGCDAPVSSAATELGAFAAVAARLEVDGPPSHGAFLFARLGDGWRLVDHLLDPSWTHGGHCKVRFRLKWEGKDARFLATADVLSERVCHMPLDQQELAAGESDVASRECQHARYGVSGNSLTRLSREGSDASCQFD